MFLARPAGWQSTSGASQAASAWYVEQPLESVVRCRRCPGRRPCPGHLRLARTQDREIIWHCVVCGENGVIRGWEGTRWDLSAPGRVAEFVAVVPAEITLHSLRRTVENLDRRAGTEALVRRASRGWVTEAAQEIYSEVGREDRVAAGRSLLRYVFAEGAK